MTFFALAAAAQTSSRGKKNLKTKLSLQPKIAAHAARCSCSQLTCVDCSREFDKWSVGQHVSCVTEHDKYAKGATKPGGAAANGFFGNGGAAPAAAAPAAAASAAASNSKGGSSSEAAIEGAEHLSTRFPWKCRLCGVSCTSQDTLAGHASGLKHRRRARAAAKNKGGGKEGGAEEEEAEGEAAAAAATASPSTPPQKGAVSEAPAKEQKKEEKKKRKQEDGDDRGGSGSSKKQKEQQKQPKWKKLALSVLSSTESKKGMKVSKLLDAVLKAVGISSGAGNDGERKKEEALAAWHASGKLRVEGGRVFLA